MPTKPTPSLLARSEAHNPIARLAAKKHRDRIAKPAVKPDVARSARRDSKIIPERRSAAASAASDMASLDQFVMTFYGQSWRYGDARKRAALEKSRSGFVARRGACLAEACKRAAYLKLQRDVSAIVESGQPTR